MNDLEMVTSKIVSAREIIDAAIDRIQEHQYDKAETMMSAAYEFLEYYLNEFDDKFKLAWQETAVKQKKEEDDAWDAVNKEKEYYEPSMPPWGHSDLEYASKHKESLTCDKVDSSPECKGAWNSFWEENYYPEEYKGSTISSVQYTDKELDAMCDKAEKEDKYKPKNGVNYNQYVKAQIEANSAWNDGWTREYYQKIVDKYEGKKDKVKKWVLPVEECKDTDTDKTEYFVSFPNDLLEAANLKEGDQVEWIDRKDGSYELRKVTRPLGMDEC